MEKFKAVIQYDGASYCGWQFQPDEPTIQDEIEKVLSRILKSRIRIYGAGRTDSGVHATGQVAHFHALWRHDTEKLKKALNSLLPRDISVVGLEKADPDFHARHSSVSKTYTYSVLNQSCRIPFHRLYSCHIPQRLDMELMNLASAALVGTHDFAAFGAPTDGTPSTVRQIYSATWCASADTGLLSFSIRGSGFLRYMVRTIVASLLRVGKREIDVDKIRIILESRDRSLAIGKAQACGLCLSRVDY
jgi:tRNA pseudouridine38-40 synthase